MRWGDKQGTPGALGNHTGDAINGRLARSLFIAPRVPDLQVLPIKPAALPSHSVDKISFAQEQIKEKKILWFYLVCKQSKYPTGQLKEKREAERERDVCSRMFKI